MVIMMELVTYVNDCMVDETLDDDLADDDLLVAHLAEDLVQAEVLLVVLVQVDDLADDEVLEVVDDDLLEQALIHSSLV